MARALAAGGRSGPAGHAETLARGDEQFNQMHGKCLPFAVRAMRRAGREALEQAGLNLRAGRIWVVPHQANLRIIEAVPDRLGIPDEDVREHRALREHVLGHHSVALDEGRKNGLFGPG